MKKLISTFAVLALALIIPTVSAPSANAATIACTGTNATITADGAGVTNMADSGMSDCVSSATNFVITGTLANIRATLLDAKQYANGFSSVTTFTIAPSDSTIALTQGDLNFIDELKTAASATNAALVLNAGNNNVNASAVTTIPSGLDVSATNVANEEELARTLKAAGLTTVTVDGKTVDAIITAADAAAAGEAQPAAGEKAVTNTSSAPVNGFALIAFAAFALAGVGFASRKYSRN